MIAIAASFAAIFSILPSEAQTGNIRVYLDPVLMKDLFYDDLTTAIKSAFSAEPFVRVANPGNGVLIISETEKPNFSEGSMEFSVSFFRNGSHLGDSIETCAQKKPSECADQLASDAKSAAAIGD
jgi:hypothetical protein